MRARVRASGGEVWGVRGEGGGRGRGRGARTVTDSVHMMALVLRASRECPAMHCVLNHDNVIVNKQLLHNGIVAAHLYSLYVC